MKNALKELMIKRIIAFYKTKEKYGRLKDNSCFNFAAKRKEPSAG